MSFANPSIPNAPIRYFGVMLCGYIADFAIFTALMAIDWSPYFSNALAFCVGTIVNVALIRTYVFPASRFPFTKDVLLTIIANGTMFIFGMCLLWLLIDAFNTNPFLSKLLANGITFVLNYATRSIFFRK